MSLSRGLMPSSLFSPRFPSFFEDMEDQVNQLASWQNLYRNDIQIESDDNNLWVKVPMPGLDTSEIEVTLKEGILYIKGEHGEQKKEQHKDRKIWRQATRSYSCSVNLPEQVDENSVNASCENGLLLIKFGKTRKSDTKKIPVNRSNK